MLALGRHERIVGGAGSDQLGSRGAGNEIRGRGGNDLLHGGRGDILDGGPGDDLIVASTGGAIIRTGPGRDKVMSSRRGNLISCAPGSQGVLIYASRADTVAPSCRRNRSEVFRTPHPTASRRAHDAAAQPVTADGSNDNPYTALCDDHNAFPDCTASSLHRAPSLISGRTSTSPATVARPIPPTCCTSSTTRSAPRSRPE